MADQADLVGPVPPPALAALAAGDVVVVASSVVGHLGAVQAASAPGLVFEVVDVAEQGLDALVELVRVRGASVVVVPGLLGRWLPTGGAPGAPETSVRTVVAVGSELDPVAAANWRAALGPAVEVVAWTARTDAALWEVEARLQAVGGVAGATVALRADDRPPLARVWVPDAASADRAALEAIAQGAGVQLRIDDAPHRPARHRGAPTSELDGTIAEIAARMLGTGALDPDDVLVDHGLDATAAAWIVHEIDWRLGVRLRAAELIESATIAGLAARVQRATSEAGPRPVTIALTGPGDGRDGRLFLLHDLDGSPFTQLALARSVGGDVVGFESPLLAGTPNPFRDLELMAMRYLVDVRRVQPEGPYRLAGRGFGGVLAFEMARQLTDQGAEISQLIVADTGPAAITTPLPRSARIGHAAAERYRQTVARAGRPRPPISVPDRVAAAVEGHRLLVDRYRWPTATIAGEVVVGWSDGVGSWDATLGWRPMAGGDLRVERLPSAPDPDDAPADAEDPFAALLRAPR